MILGDAADERLIPANPIRRQRRGSRHHDMASLPDSGYRTQ
jgi:hypothetical protein